MKVTKFGLLTFALIGITSCDSSTPASLTDPTLVANNISESQNVLLGGDEITYTSVTSTQPLVQTLEFVNGTQARSFGTPVYVYRKINTNGFEMIADYNAQINLTTALDRALGDPSPIGTRLRAILLRFNPNTPFTTAELNEIVTILNAVGAEISLNPSDPTQLLSAARRRYVHEVTSNNTDLFAGVQSGNHQVKETSFIIAFRDVTSADLNRYRLLATRHKLPFVTNTSLPSAPVEIGRWVLRFANR